MAVSDVDTGEYYMKNTTWVYPDADVMDVSETPMFDDLRNKIMIVGLPMYFKGTDFSNFAGTDDFNLIRVEGEITTTPAFSWDRGMFQVIPGNYSKDEFDNAAKRWVQWAQTVYFDATATIPGNSQIRLLQQFECSYGTFVVLGMSHDINFESKEWTTSLTLQRADDNATEDEE